MSIYKPLKVYEKNNDFSFVTDRNNYLENCIKGKTVLHIGCSDYPITEERIKSHNLLHEKLQNSAKEILGAVSCFIDDTMENLEIDPCADFVAELPDRNWLKLSNARISPAWLKLFSSEQS